ncbi:hypothetical protein P4O66_021719 [Electrophorus voltai]|uniref:Uncharacterized protein n=1 Tax=Electrophorus voltai TaxID=2609070 RepID=A0AAD8ZPR4_9TELE|nr:hypothetical protein P4O66_021719 [Electrophorus voltai]
MISFSLPACSSFKAVTLSSNELAALLACKLSGSVIYSKDIWKLFFQTFAVSLDGALDIFSGMKVTLTRPDPDVLDALGEVKVNNFSATQLTDAAFITTSFQIRLRPFLSLVSTDFLFSLSSKNFSCQTYEIVVDALSRQTSLMEEVQKEAIVNNFIYPFLSRNDLSDPKCATNMTSISNWLEKNFGNFSAYATLTELQNLNGNFSSFGSLDLLSPTQVAELTLSFGALNSTSQMIRVFNRLETGDAFTNVDVFLTALTSQGTVNITPSVRDFMMNQTFKIISVQFPEFETSTWSSWFTGNLIPLLPSITSEMLTITISNISCTNYEVM